MLASWALMSTFLSTLIQASLLPSRVLDVLCCKTEQQPHLRRYNLRNLYETFFQKSLQKRFPFLIKSEKSYFFSKLFSWLSSKCLQNLSIVQTRFHSRFDFQFRYLIFCVARMYSNLTQTYQRFKMYLQCRKQF